MAELQFPNGLEGSDDLPKTKKSLVNCYKTKEGWIEIRPGVSLLNTLTATVARGVFVFNDSLYMLFTNTLRKITDLTTGAFTNVGTISGAGDIQVAIGFVDAVILDPGGSIYTLSKTDVLTLISGNTNFVPCVSVTAQGNRFIYCPSSGDPVFFSDVGDAGTVNVLSFFDAEQLPDRNNQVFTLKNFLYIMGTNSAESFVNRGTSPIPYSTRNAAIDVGFIGGLLEYGNTFLFVGRDKDQDFGIYAIGSGVAPKISNRAIDTILETYTLEELGEVRSARFKWRGDDIATFTFRRDAFGFFNGNWFRLSKLGERDFIPWGGGFIAQFEGSYFSAFEDKIGVLDEVNTDYGIRLPREIQFGIRQPDGQWFTVQSAALGISQGFNPLISTSLGVAIQVSRDNVLFSELFYRDVGILGKYSDLLEWNYPGGMGVYKGFMAVKIFTTEDIKFSADHLIVDANGPLQLA